MYSMYLLVKTRDEFVSQMFEEYKTKEIYLSIDTLNLVWEIIDHMVDIQGGI